MGTQTKAARRKKPKKPAGSPLTVNGNGQWSKKIRGAVHYFGPWADHEGAVKEYWRVKADLEAGRRPQPADMSDGDGVTVEYLGNHFLTTKRDRVQSDEIGERTFGEYLTTCRTIVDSLGKSTLVAKLTPADFGTIRRRWSKRMGPVALTNQIQRARSVFAYGFREGLIDRPVRYGDQFSRPNRGVIRKAKMAAGPRSFTAAEVRQLLDAARDDERLGAIVLLGINGGYGPTDCGVLRIDQIDLAKGWIDHPRPKTGIARRTPLWPETVAALRSAIAARPEPKSDVDADIVFLTQKTRRRMVHAKDNEITKVFRKLSQKADVEIPGRGLYGLRRSFATAGSEARDPDALRLLMGHTAESMLSVYQDRVPDRRLRAVVDVVHGWLNAVGDEGGSDV